jgi:hypothetical protein
MMSFVKKKKMMSSWSFKLGDQFSVSSLYMYLYKKILPPSHFWTPGIIAKVWGSWAPTKVIVFSWQALLGRLPTTENLVCRGTVLEGPNVGCVLCGRVEKWRIICLPLAQRLGWYGPSSSVVWYDFGGSIYNWLLIPMLSSSLPEW